MQDNVQMSLQRRQRTAIALRIFLLLLFTFSKTLIGPVVNPCQSTDSYSSGGLAAAGV